MENLKPIRTIQAGAMVNGIQMPALKYRSGGRDWLAITVQYKALGKFITTSSVKKKNQEIIKSKLLNRFLDPKHKNEIKDYIKTEQEFTLPPITLVSFEELIFQPVILNDIDKELSVDQLMEKYGSITGMVYMPLDYEFFCLDGNHRTVAISELANENPEFIEGSSMLLNIVYESRSRKIRQDFVDVNKNAKNTTPSINTLFNTRDPLSGVVADLMDEISYLDKTTELLATSISKNSKNIYTINNLKNAVVELSGTKANSTAAINKVSKKMDNDKEFKELVKYRSLLFFRMLKENIHIKECLLNEAKVPEIRANSILTSGAGLTVISRVAGAVFEYYQDQEEVVSKLNNLINWDWSRKNEFFLGVLVNIDGNITPGQNVFTAATNKLLPYFVPNNNLVKNDEE
ncbi:DNA sulfur modification protein DndB [Mesobacillus maritimus]|uniref:DNA sulfur modification protein DndB n=1 Tax=Mesobacillus maritimus TaxID=1643336 RepID=UPI00203C456B|nr:DNA sulfur modification protein DndB [Mesobacillus maritimus]MCM3585014.1 DNA sulfur modification protein DndB [Mesobacillus maritimus]